jgi:hypothetical protein
MRLKNIFTLLLVVTCLSGCVVFSFYPIYTQKDLFPNDYLLGNYLSDDSIGWSFTHQTKKCLVYTPCNTPSDIHGIHQF